MIKLDEDVPTTTHGFYQFSIEILSIAALARIYRKEHATLYKYARDPARFPEGEVRQDPLRRLLLHCADVVAMGGARGTAAVRIVAGMIANLVECDVMPRETVCPDKADVKSECLDDYPPLVHLHELIDEHAPTPAVRDQMRSLFREVLETVVAYETAEAKGGRS